MQPIYSFNCLNTTFRETTTAVDFVQNRRIEGRSISIAHSNQPIIKLRNTCHCGKHKIDGGVFLSFSLIHITTTTEQLQVRSCDTDSATPLRIYFYHLQILLNYHRNCSIKPHVHIFRTWRRSCNSWWWIQFN